MVKVLLKSKFPFYKNLIGLITLFFLLFFCVKNVYENILIRDRIYNELKIADFAKEHVLHNIIHGRDPAHNWESQNNKNLKIEIAEVTGVITLYLMTPENDKSPKTLVLFPFYIDSNGNFLKVSLSNWNRHINWMCTSSLSKMQYAPEFYKLRGTLPSRYAPAVCRY